MIEIPGEIINSGVSAGAIYIMIRLFILPKLNMVCKRTYQLELRQVAIVTKLKDKYPDLPELIQTFRSNGGAPPLP